MTLANMSIQPTQNQKNAIFISRALHIHGARYSYDKSVYVNPSLDIVVTCAKHGDFTTTPARHIMHSEICHQCLSEELHNQKILTRARESRE